MAVMAGVFQAMSSMGQKKLVCDEQTKMPIAFQQFMMSFVSLILSAVLGITICPQLLGLKTLLLGAHVKYPIRSMDQFLCYFMLGVLAFLVSTIRPQLFKLLKVSTQLSMLNLTLVIIFVLQSTWLGLKA